MRGEQQIHGADWHSLGDALYRKWSIYDMQWSLDRQGLENYRMCGCSLGGPLAMICDIKKSLASSEDGDWSNHNGNNFYGNSKNIEEDSDAASSTSSSRASHLYMYTSSGAFISDVELGGETRLNDIVGMGWSDHEQLVTVRKSGQVLIYDIHCKLVRDFSLMEVSLGSDPPPSAEEAAAAAAARGGVLEVHFWPDGLVVLCGDMQCIAAEGLANPDPERTDLYTLETGMHPLKKPYTAMAIIPPARSDSRLLEVMLGTMENSIIVVDRNGAEDQLLQDIAAPITKIAVAPKGEYLACYRRDGVLTVLSSTFITKYVDVNTKSMHKPMDIVWCGDDAVVLQWKNTGIIMVGPDGDWINFPYKGMFHLVAEPDCCRVITSTSCDMLQRVPPSTEVIRRIGSTDPAALMYDATGAFEDGDPKSDENIRAIAASGQLNEAITNCIEAASTEFDVERQQDLLKVAAYGKTFCADADPAEFVQTAKTLRVLNEVRRPAVGMPLTIDQYHRLTPEILIARLTMRNCHYLALKICELLRLRNERVLIHWAAEKVKRMAASNHTDREITKAISEKLHAPLQEGRGTVSFLEIAASAYHMKRRSLATMILDMEKNAADQVPLLLFMGEEELALRKAINSQDTDLIYLVLMHLEKSVSYTERHHLLIHKYPEAANLLKLYYRNKVTPTDRSTLHNFLMHTKNYLEAGTSAVQQAYMQHSLVTKVQLLKEASTLFAQGRELTFFKSATDEQMELMDIQKLLETRAHRDFVGLSLTETLNNMILLGLEFPNDAALWERETQKLTKKFRVVDKQLWNIKIHCFSSNSQWGHLAKLGSEKKSPVGYKPFARACMKYGQPNVEVERYIEKIPDAEDRFDLLCEIEEWRKAADVARVLKDADRLNLVLHRCKDENLQRQISHIIEKL